MKYSQKFQVKPGSKVKLRDSGADNTLGFREKDPAKKLLDKNTRKLSELQYLLYAEGKHSLLIVLQAMDAGGKDGTIREGIIVIPKSSIIPDGTVI